MNLSFNFSFRQRIKLGFNNTVFGLSGTIFNFLFSIVIVRLFSTELWGSFAQTMLLVTLFSLVTSWGSKDFLLREFSREQRITYLWQTSIISRIAIFLLVIPVIFIFNSVSTNPLLFLGWIFVNYVLRSFESVIVYERKFSAAIIIEVIGFLFIIITIFIFRQGITLPVLIILSIASAGIKSISYFVLFRNQLFESLKGIFSKGQLLACLPYFLPPFIGFLQAKSDTFAVALQLSEKELGQYYVLLSLLSYCHATAVLAITPFLKNIYRINSASFLKIRQKFILFGLGWSIICMTIIYLMLTFIYRIDLSAQTYIIAWLVLPPYFIYFLIMQDFIRRDKPYTIVILNLIAAALNFALSLFLINRFGFNGGLLSCAIMQWALLMGFQIAYSIKHRSNKDHD